jgi:hypothetical protein
MLRICKGAYAAGEYVCGSPEGRTDICRCGKLLRYSDTKHGTLREILSVIEKTNQNKNGGRENGKDFLPGRL